MKKIYNFSAGPAVLPDEALQDTAAAVVNYNDSGMSLLEMSHHRSSSILERFVRQYSGSGTEIVYLLHFYQ
jgi:phosphoserine aminotransferase